VLGTVHGDAGNVIGSLHNTNGSLKSACSKLGPGNPC